MTATEKLIYNILMTEIKNPYGVAGLMGNLYAESRLNPKAMGGKNRVPYTVDEYIQIINRGEYSEDLFAHDGVPFGIAQWFYWSRKQGLYQFAKGKDISDIRVQLGYLLKEIRTYKTVWNTLLNAKTLQEASDIVLEKYEKPGNISDATRQKRAEYGMNYLDISDIPEPVQQKGTYVRTTARLVNIRSGNGKSFEILGQVGNAGTEYPYVATTENNWHAIRMKTKNAVGWIDGTYAEVIEK